MLTKFLVKRNTILAGFGLIAMAATATATASNVAAAHAPAAATIVPAVSHGLKLDIAPQGYDCSTATASPFYCLAGENDSAVNGFSYGVYGVEGYAPNATGGVGVLGYAGKSSVSGAYGVYGVTFATNGIGVYGAGDGPTPSPGTTPNSSLQSTGVVGDSHSGDGVFGSTEFPNSSDGLQIAGVVGMDNATGSHENDGVLGITTSGDAGVYGSATSGSGVLGDSSSGPGGNFFSGTNTALVGQNTTSSGMSAVYGGDSGTDPGVWGVNKYGTGGFDFGVRGESLNGAGVLAVSDGASTSSYAIGLIAQSNNFPIVAYDSKGPIWDVDGTGTAHTLATTRNGLYATTFTARASSPTIEDTGGGQLVNGTGTVRLDPAVVEQMDRSTTYRVFLTPDGDTRGLYVASKTPQGFVVRETQGGRGTLAFDYRIVASVDGQANRRTTLSTSPALPRLSTQAGRTLPEFNVGGARKGIGEARARISSAKMFVPRPNFAIENRTR